jgi:hypothetical protein
MANQDSIDSAKLDLASIDDEQFESLIAAIFSAKILRPAIDENPVPDSLNHTVVEVSHTGRGADEGKDLMLTTLVSDCIITRPFKWLVQCKHKAKSKRSVQINDFKDGSFVDVVRQHGADGYLLVCSTRPARNLHSRFEALTDDSSNSYPFVIWDGTRVCEEAHRHPRVIELFFPDYYRSHFQREIEFEDVVGWIQRKKVSVEERSILSAALSEVVSPDDAPDDENESGREQR